MAAKKSDTKAFAAALKASADGGRKQGHMANKSKKPAVATKFGGTRPGKKK